MNTTKTNKPIQQSVRTIAHLHYADKSAFVVKMNPDDYVEYLGFTLEHLVKVFPNNTIYHYVAPKWLPVGAV